MRKRYLFITILVLLFAYCVPAYAAPTTYTRTKNDLRLPKDVSEKNVDIDTVLKTPSVDEKAKIYDFADLLTEAEEIKIYIQLNEYINNTGIDAAIITTNDLGGLAMKDYTYNFYDYNDFKTIGVAFVIYVGNDRTSIFMGNNGPASSEVFTAYTDKNVTQILKYVYDQHIKDKDYVGACETYIKLIDGFYVNSFGSYKVGEDDNNTMSFPWIEVAIISFVLSFILIVLVITKYQKPERRVDLTIRKAINTNSMVVKCEYDRAVVEKATNS